LGTSPSARYAGNEKMSVLKNINLVDGSKQVIFFCPGCKCGHVVWVNPYPRGTPRWKFNGDYDKPTFEPSLLVHTDKRCHSFVKDGKIQFLADSTHELAGKTIALQDFDQQI
jgi:hypothetical protein